MNVDVTLARALAAAARAFADEIDRGLPQGPLAAPVAPTPGSAQSMLEVLRSVAHINHAEARGASDDEMRAIARRAGMDPRGMAGYYAANLLEKRDDGTRWVSPGGLDRLHALGRIPPILGRGPLLDSPVSHQPEPPPNERSRGPAAFEAMYAGPPPPWDIGRPQPAFLRLAESGALRGRVLDVGCGTGEHALMAAGLGLRATGIDAAPTAIYLANIKAAQRGQQVRFIVWNALDLSALGEQFDTVLDCGLFHVFDDADRFRYVESLRAVVAPEGRYAMLCFSDRVPGTVGPRRVSQDEIRASFADGWHVQSVEPVTIETTLPIGPAAAWLAVITRVPEDPLKSAAE